MRRHRLTLIVGLLTVATAGAQVIDGTVESQVKLLKTKVTVAKQIGPKALRDVAEELSTAHNVTFVINVQEFKKAGRHDILAAQVTVAAAKDAELAAVLDRMLGPVGAKCVPDRGFLSIVPK